MLTLWNPFVPVTRERSDSRMSARNYLDRLFDDAVTSWSRDLFAPDLIGLGIEHKKNEDGSLAVAVDIPGIKEEDIAIEIHDNIISVNGKRKTAASSYSVSKSFTIPEGYSSDDVRAELSDGVLTLTLIAKSIPEKEVKKIPITTPSKQLNK